MSSLYQDYMPLYEALKNNIKKKPLSFHVPGHKYGKVFSEGAFSEFTSVLKMDATEVSGLDDLHAPNGSIEEAQLLASHYFGSTETFFLVNGTTVGNHAMILSVCHPGDQVIVQRNCHKSVLNGLELAGASPIFITPRYEKETHRYSKVCAEDLSEALTQYPECKAVFLTYPDYFGRTYDLASIAELVHHHNIPLLIDEAHGVHFQLGAPFPKPALSAGADAVVQSAHKMAPAMTMASLLHIQGQRVNVKRIRHYLQVLQSSSPSYPLMTSLDIARFYLASMKKEDKDRLLLFVEQVREVFASYDHLWKLKPLSAHDDSLKMILEPTLGTGFDLGELLETGGIIPEMATSQQVLLLFGLAESFPLNDLKQRLASIDWRLKKRSNHATIKKDQLPFPKIQRLEYSYLDMQRLPEKKVDWLIAPGYIAAEAIIPYPPGVPLIMKGELISETHRHHVRVLIEQGARFQNKGIEQGIRVFKGE